MRLGLHISFIPQIYVSVAERELFPDLPPPQPFLFLSFVSLALLTQSIVPVPSFSVRIEKE